jgi:acyl carrier protein
MVTKPKLSRVHVSKVLTDALASVSKERAPKIISENLKVLDEWEIDSEHGLEVAIELSIELGIEIPANDNPLIDETSESGRKRARTFGEVIDHLVSLQPL